LFVELKDGSQIFWNPLFAPEIARRYRDAGWAKVEYKIGAVPESSDKDYCTAHYYLVFTPPNELSASAKDQNAEIAQAVNYNRPVSHRAGWVYLLKAENGLYKIGRSKKPKIRVSAITKAVAPFEIVEMHKAFYNDCVKVEKYFHLKFKNKCQRGEWFALTENEVKYIIEHQYEPL
jgi:T5orf172 domain